MKKGVTPAQRIRLLESELAATRADLQSHIEQFRGLNEELITVNSRLQKKILEQERLNNDLTNFLTSTGIPTVFLDHQFRVKRFTPAMSKLLKLIPSDMGRPITDMSRESLGPDLLSDAMEVLDTLAPARKEVNIGETWYVRAVLPYRTSDNRIEGVVVTYNDITGLKQAEECNARLASFPQLNPNPVIEVDPSGRVTYANAASYKALESMGLDGDNVMPLLPQDLGAIVAEWDRKTEAAFYREIELKDRVFGATIQLAPQFNVVRVYVFEITKRRRAEEALRRAKEEWELTFDSVPDLVAIIDNEHRIRRVNRAMARRLGLTPEQCVGLRCYEHVHGTCAPPLFCPHSRTILDGREHAAEVSEKRLGGDFIVTTTPLVDVRGGRIGSVHVAHDITARKRAEALSGRLAALVKSADDAIISEDMNGVIQSWNIGAEKIFGYSEKEALGRNISFLIPPGHRDEIPDIRGRIARGEHIDHFESVRRRKDETIIPVSLTFSAIRDADEKIIGISKIAHNITERRQAEEALKQSLSRIELLTWTAGELLRSAEPQKAVESVCRKVMEQLDCHTFFNFLADEKAGRLRLNACAGIPREEARKIEWLDYGVTVCGCAARDGGRIVVEHIVSTRDERAELVKSFGVKAYACHPLTGPGGRVLGTLSFGTCSRETFKDDDLSLMKAVADQVAVAMMRIGVEQALRQHTDALEEANRELESFIYSVSHDLRAPLRHISGFVGILMEDYDGQLDAQGNDYLARIRKGSERMARLIDDLLYLSRISRQEMSTGSVDLSAISLSLISELREANPGRQAEVHIGEGLCSPADPRLITLALRNLLENAWKFTSNNGNARIEFNAAEKEGKTVYYVKDNGAGFDQEFAGRMFWPFHRLHTEQEFEGTGIGLAIVERVIRRHGGKVWAEGQPGKGAVIYFTLE